MCADSQVDISEEDANDIFNELKQGNYQLYDGLKNTVYSILNGAVKDQKRIWLKQRTLKKLKEAIGFYTLNNPLPSGNPDPKWLNLTNEINDLLRMMASINPPP